MTDEIHEYRVRPVTRYIVTSFHQTPDGKADGRGHGEFENADTAYQVARALCREKHEELGYELGDDRIKYPIEPGLSECIRSCDPRLVEGEVTTSGQTISNALGFNPF